MNYFSHAINTNIKRFQNLLETSVDERPSGERYKGSSPKKKQRGLASVESEEGIGPKRAHASLKFSHGQADPTAISGKADTIWAK
jgi:hypothetical protein